MDMCNHWKLPTGYCQKCGIDMTLLIEETQLELNPPIHTWATKLCPHCGEFRNMTGFIEGLWESNVSEEVKDYLFHEPYLSLSNYWHENDLAFLEGLFIPGREQYLVLFRPGDVHQIWGDGKNGCSRE